jgi:quercetin dioxygenase-like cupin family protein
MNELFPTPIQRLPQIDVPVPGFTGYLVQGAHHQVVFMHFDNDIELPAHSHDDQWEIVLEGTVDLHRNDTTTRYRKGDRFFIPKGIIHSATVHAGYTAIVFFNEHHRYTEKKVNGK